MPKTITQFRIWLNGYIAGGGEDLLPVIDELKRLHDRDTLKEVIETINPSKPAMYGNEWKADGYTFNEKAD